MNWAHHSSGRYAHTVDLADAEGHFRHSTLDLDDLGDLANCPTRSSVLGLAVAVAMMVVLYICTICVFCMRRAIKKGAPGSGGKMRDYLR